MFDYEKFLCLINEYEITTYKVAKETCLNQVVFSDWKSGKSTPKADKIKKIADYFGVSIEYFM